MGCGMTKNAKKLSKSCIDLEKYCETSNDSIRNLRASQKELKLSEKRKQYQIRIFTPEKMGLADNSVSLHRSSSNQAKSV
ncbi:unnamed protein product [Blepharisma stoltei]|uniref:Uncharacterized protein n=1 Tax=Blepharisma stoltei TaxID=1481888 RepID=A0AAU9IQ38_9CILI|nr:unnamed protein product [Blepharisma stoltei]